MTALSLVIPAFRAGRVLRERLPSLLATLDEQRLDYEVVVVDDGSDDGSDELIEGMAGPRLKIVLLEENLGKYGALRAGMKASRGECRIFTDADIPYDLAVIPYMVRLVRDLRFHVVVGDRTLPGAVYEQQLGPVRKVATNLFTHFVRLLVTGGLHDTQCGIKAFRADAADALFPLLQERGFAGDVELLYVALHHNLAVRRVPVRLQHQGPSTVRPLVDGWRMLRSLFKLRLRRRAGLYDSEELRALASQDYWSEGGARYET